MPVARAPPRLARFDVSHRRKSAGACFAAVLSTLTAADSLATAPNTMDNNDNSSNDTASPDDYSAPLLDRKLLDPVVEQVTCGVPQRPRAATLCSAAIHAADNRSKKHC